LWVASIEAAVDRRWPTWRLFVALLVGLSGIAVLTGPRLMAGGSADGWALLALVGAGLSWGMGLVLQQRHPVRLKPAVSAAYQQLFGAVSLGVTALIVGEPWPSPSTDAWLAFGYLTIFGSLVAFTSFVVALRLLPATVVTTYAYVNPVIAVLLGAVVLGEAITGWTLAGAALVLLAVALIFRERSRRQHRGAGVAR
jgi:drug/metabolite transporter (DMT)-like permease